MQRAMAMRAAITASGHGVGADVNQYVVHLSIALDPGSVAAAFREALHRHVALRARLASGGDGAQAFVIDDERLRTPEVAVVDLAGANADSVADARTAWLAADRERGLSAFSAPMMRITLLRAASGGATLVWTVHHFAVDGASAARVLREVLGLALGRARSESPLADDCEAYRAAALLHARQLDDARGYWERKLGERAAPTPPPGLIGSDLTGASAAHITLRRALPVGPFRAALEQARQRGVYPSAALEAAWALTLARLANEPVVSFGAVRTLHPRTSDSGTRAVGNFINTLPRRLDLTAARDLSDLLLATQQQLELDAAHAGLAIHEIAHAAHATGQPLAYTLFLYDPQSVQESLRDSGYPELADATVEVIEQPTMPLAVIVSGGAAPELRVIYDAARVTPASAQLCSSGFVRMLEAFAGDLHVELASLDALSHGEQAALLAQANDTGLTPSWPELLHAGFEARAQLQPDSVVCASAEGNLRYGELASGSDALARWLAARGIGRGERVAVALPRGPRLLLALYGVLKAGAAYVPLDVAHPVARSHALLDACRPALLITSARSAPQLAHYAEGSLAHCPVLDLDDTGAWNHAPLAPLPEVRSTDLAYIIFTSGSTGAPKGVMVSHRAAANTLAWVNRTFDVSAADRVLAINTPCFDLSVYDYFGVPAAGGALVMPSAGELASPELLARKLHTSHITLWNSAPPALQRLLDSLRELGEPQRQLKLILLSGDVLPRTLPEALRGHFPGARLVNLGGATEAAIWSNYHVVEPSDDGRASIPYGRPISNARYHVLDARLRPVPVGVTGRLFIGGLCLAEGYFQQPELSAERFVPDPYRPGERIYDTGDLARYCEPGLLEFVGRRDQQVKVRGHRVELGEVEHAIARLPRVRQAICATYVDASEQLSLAAFYETLDGAALAEDSVREQLAALLPYYMVPSRLLRVPALPLTPNGKVDRAALLALLQQPSAPDDSDTALPAHVGAMVALWRDVLRVPAIGPDTSFFDAGGHSLLAVQLVGEIHRRLEARVPLGALLEHPTPRALAAAVESLGREAARQSSVRTLRAGGSETPIVLATGTGGHAFIFQQLVGVISPSRPLYALQAIGAELDDPLTATSVPDQARAHYHDLRQRMGQVSRVILAGYSFGATVAFELARLFTDDGVSVELLVSLDGFAPGYPRRLSWRDSKLDNLRAALDPDPERRSEYWRGKLSPLRARVARLVGRAAVEPAPPADPHEAEFDAHLAALRGMLREAKHNYAPSHRVDCNILLIRCSSPERWVGWDAHDPAYGWRPYTRGHVSTIMVGGTHAQIFDGDNALVIARAIEEASATRAEAHG
jgi:amino acid adenylation domain-containing protein